MRVREVLTSSVKLSKSVVRFAECVNELRRQRNFRRRCRWVVGDDRPATWERPDERSLLGREVLGLRGAYSKGFPTNLYLDLALGKGAFPAENRRSMTAKACPH